MLWPSAFVFQRAPTGPPLWPRGAGHESAHHTVGNGLFLPYACSQPCACTFIQSGFCSMRPQLAARRMHVVRIHRALQLCQHASQTLSMVPCVMLRHPQIGRDFRGVLRLSVGHVIYASRYDYVACMSKALGLLIPTLRSCRRSCRYLREIYMNINLTHFPGDGVLSSNVWHPDVSLKCHRAQPPAADGARHSLRLCLYMRLGSNIARPLSVQTA